MMQVYLRILVWVAVFGIGYLVFGPKLFDSSSGERPFASDSPLFLPPAKTERHIELEARLADGRLGREEAAEYQRLAQERVSNFWQRRGVTVEDVLSGVQTGRRAHLVSVLEQRGMSAEESSIFLMVVERDHPGLLADRR